MAYKALSIGYATTGDIITASTVLPILSIIAVALRFYVRFTRKNELGADDWLTIPGLLTIIGYGVTMIIGVELNAIGYPTPQPPSGASEDAILKNLDPTIENTQKVEYAATVLLVLAYCFIKLSVLFFYRRLFVIHKRNYFNYATWIMIGVVVAWTIAFLFSTIFACGTRFFANWGSREELMNDCDSGHEHEQALYISDFLLNCVLIVLPLPVIWRLHVKTSQKFAISGIVLLAFMSVIASIVRLVLVIQATSQSYEDDYDQDQTISTCFYWSLIEGGLALIACCLPSLRALIYGHGVRSAVRSAKSAFSIPADSRHQGTKEAKSSFEGSNEPFRHHMGPAGLAGLPGFSSVEGLEVENEIRRSESVRAPEETLKPGEIRVMKEVDVDIV